MLFHLNELTKFRNLFLYIDGKRLFRHQASIEVDEDWTDDPEVKSPLHYFSEFFSPDIIKDIVEQTNLYSVALTGKSINVTEAQLKY